MSDETCRTCQDFSHKFQCCFCPLNNTTFGGYLRVSETSGACRLYKRGKNDAPDAA